MRRVQKKHLPPPTRAETQPADELKADTHKREDSLEGATCPAKSDNPVSLSR
jgi:hypothetical protein